MPDIWASLFLPLIRLLVGLSIGLLVANLLETLQWTATLARFAVALARLAHFHPVSGAAFSWPSSRQLQPTVCFPMPGAGGFHQQNLCWPIFSTVFPPTLFICRHYSF